jgi:hypothetical protein
MLEKAGVRKRFDTRGMSAWPASYAFESLPAGSQLNTETGMIINRVVIYLLVVSLADNLYRGMS